MEVSDPSICLWFKKESNTKSARFITDIQVSYTKADQVDLSRKNYEKLPQCLSSFGLGYANIYILWKSSTVVRLTDSDHIKKELNDYSAMLIKNPNDKILAQMVDKAKWRLREAQLAEEDHAKDIPGDDLQYTKEFLALRSKELRKMKKIYKTIDFDRDGKISIEDFVLFLREPLSMSPFIRQIFTFSAPSNGMIANYPAGNDEPMMDVGATLRAVAVFCMLGSTELVKFLFSWYDTKGYGEIDNKQFLDILGLFHPRHRDDVVVRAQKDIHLSADGKMVFSKFESECKKFPHILYPAFRVQANMRKQFFGTRWWKTKLAKYIEAKEMLEEERRQEQEIEDIERRQRYEISEELKNESIDIYEIKKKHRRGRR